MPPVFGSGPAHQPSPRKQRQWVIPAVAAGVAAALVVVVIAVVSSRDSGGTPTGAGPTGTPSPTVTVPLEPSVGSPTGTGTPATGGEPWRDPQGRFTLLPPAGWTINDSGEQGVLVLFFAPETAYTSDGTPFQSNVNVVTAGVFGTRLADLLPTTRTELSALPDYVSTTDEPTQLTDGTPAHLFGGTFTDAASGLHLQNLQLLAVTDDTLIVVTGTAPVDAWAAYGSELDAILRTLDV
jgi:hypothetical protein